MLILTKLWVEKVPVNYSSCLNHSPAVFQLVLGACPSQSAAYPQAGPWDGDFTPGTGSTLSRRSPCVSLLPDEPQRVQGKHKSAQKPPGTLPSSAILLCDISAGIRPCCGVPFSVYFTEGG